MSKVSRALSRLDRKAMAAQAAWSRTYLQLRFAFSGNTFEAFGSGNRFVHDFCRIKNSLITVMGSNNCIEIGAGTELENTRLTIAGSNSRVIIGKNSAIAGNYIWLTENDSELLIGDNTIVRESQVVMTEKGCRIHIGNECMIAFGSDVRCGDGHAIYDVNTGEIFNRAREIIIEDHVWLTSEAKALKNVRIGTGSIIGSRAVVTRDIPPRSLAVGAPAKVIRSNVTWHRNNIDRLPQDWFERESKKNSRERI